MSPPRTEDDRKSDPELEALEGLEELPEEGLLLLRRPRSAFLFFFFFFAFSSSTWLFASAFRRSCSAILSSMCLFRPRLRDLLRGASSAAFKALRLSPSSSAATPLSGGPGPAKAASRPVSPGTMGPAALALSSMAARPNSAACSFK